MKYRAEQVGGVWCVVDGGGNVVESFGIGPSFKALAEKVAAQKNAGVG